MAYRSSFIVGVNINIDSLYLSALLPLALSGEGSVCLPSKNRASRHQPLLELATIMLLSLSWMSPTCLIEDIQPLAGVLSLYSSKPTSSVSSLTCMLSAGAHALQS